MKISFVIVLLGLCQSYGMTLNKYAADYAANPDKLYRPLTKEMCNKEPHRSKLKSCRLLHQNKKRLMKISSRYLTPSLNLWSEKEYNKMLKKAIATHRYQLMRGKRSANFDRRVATDFPHRSKRAIWSNPCRESEAQRTTLLHAVDAETGIKLELFQNAEQQLYQTFFTKECQPYSHPLFICKLQYIEFRTAVFHPLSTDPSLVLVRPVKIPSGCAMRISLSGNKK